MKTSHLLKVIEFVGKSKRELTVNPQRSLLSVFQTRFKLMDNFQAVFPGDVAHLNEEKKGDADKLGHSRDILSRGLATWIFSPLFPTMSRVRFFPLCNPP